MSRTKTDTIIGIAGAVAIAFALIGVFAYEYNNVSDSNGDHMEPGDLVPSEEHSGSLGQDGSFEGPFTPSEGVSGMTVRIEWDPAAPDGADAFAGYSYELAMPDGTVITSGSSVETETFIVETPVAGEYTFTISAPSPSLGGDFVVEATYDY